MSILIYHIIFLALIGITIYSLTHFNKQFDHKLALWVSVFFIIIGTIKWKIGPDWGHYYRFFLYISATKNPLLVHEPIYSYINLLAKHTLNSFLVVQFIQVLICIYCKYNAFKRYTKYLMFAMLLNYGFYLADMFTVRNFLAASVAFWGIKYIEEKKMMRFFLTIIVATNIHVSSIVFLIAYPVYHIRTSIILKVNALLISIVLGVLNVVDKLVNQSTYLTFLFSDRINNKLEGYTEIGNSGENQNKDSLLIMILGIIKRSIIFPIIYYFEYYYYKEDKQFRGLVNLFTFGNVIYFSTMQFKIFQRMSIPFYIVEIPLLLMIYKKAKHKFLFFVIFTIYAFTKLWVMVRARYMGEFITIFTRHISSMWNAADKGIWQ